MTVRFAKLVYLVLIYYGRLCFGIVGENSWSLSMPKPHCYIFPACSSRSIVAPSALASTPSSTLRHNIRRSKNIIAAATRKQKHLDTYPILQSVHASVTGDKSTHDGGDGNEAVDTGWSNLVHERVLSGEGWTEGCSVGRLENLLLRYAGGRLKVALLQTGGGVPARVDETEAMEGQGADSVKVEHSTRTKWVRGLISTQQVAAGQAIAVREHECACLHSPGPIFVARPPVYIEAHLQPCSALNHACDQSTDSAFGRDHHSTLRPAPLQRKVADGRRCRGRGGALVRQHDAGAARRMGRSPGARAGQGGATGRRE